MIKLLRDILSVGFAESLAIALVPAVRSEFFSGNSADSLSSQTIWVIVGVRSPPREGKQALPKAWVRKGFPQQSQPATRLENSRVKRSYPGGNRADNCYACNPFAPFSDRGDI